MLDGRWVPSGETREEWAPDDECHGLLDSLAGAQYSPSYLEGNSIVMTAGVARPGATVTIRTDREESSFSPDALGRFVVVERYPSDVAFLMLVVSDGDESLMHRFTLP